MLSYKSPIEQMEHLRDAFRDQRLRLRLTQETLSRRAGVSLGSLKRFESTAEISLRHLMMIAVPLGLLDQFSKISAPDTAGMTIDELKKLKQTPKRGRV